MYEEDTQIEQESTNKLCDVKTKKDVNNFDENLTDFFPIKDFTGDILQKTGDDKLEDIFNNISKNFTGDHLQIQKDKKQALTKSDIKESIN